MNNSRQQQRHSIPRTWYTGFGSSARLSISAAAAPHQFSRSGKLRAPRIEEFLNMLSIKPDHWIRRQAHQCGMIEPFEDGQVRDGVISYGLSSFGYDIRVAQEFRIFTPATGQLTVIDPKAVDERALQSYRGDACIIPPNSFALARTIEYFRIPRNVLAICSANRPTPAAASSSTLPRSSRSGRATSPSRSATPPRCRPASTPVKASPRCCSSKAKSRRSPTPTAMANTRSRPVSPCPAYRGKREEEREHDSPLSRRVSSYRS